MRPMAADADLTTEALLATLREMKRGTEQAAGVMRARGQRSQAAVYISYIAALTEAIQRLTCAEAAEAALASVTAKVTVRIGELEAESGGGLAPFTGYHYDMEYTVALHELRALLTDATPETGRDDERDDES